MQASPLCKLETFASLAQNLAIFNFRLFRKEADTDKSQPAGQSILDVVSDLASQLIRKLEVLSGKIFVAFASGRRAARIS